ncbi:hypothetical protein BJX70DRAFT_401082 [Aspergillus crustosus]
MAFEYKKVLILGATSGIGKSLATRFVKENSKNGRDKVDTIVFDITKLDQISSFLSDIFTKHPDNDCVFVNPGIQRPFDFSNPGTVDLPTFDEELLVNYTSAVHFSKALLPYLQKQQNQTTIAFTSQMALVPMMRCPGYGASKAALHHFILALRTQLNNGPGDIRVIEIYPPAVQTELHDTKHQPDLKDGHLIGMPVEEFVESVWQQLVEGEDQIAVGSARDV